MRLPKASTQRPELAEQGNKKRRRPRNFISPSESIQKRDYYRPEKCLLETQQLLLMLSPGELPDCCRFLTTSLASNVPNHQCPSSLVSNALIGPMVEFSWTAAMKSRAIVCRPCAASVAFSPPRFSPKILGAQRSERSSQSEVQVLERPFMHDLNFVNYFGCLQFFLSTISFSCKSHDAPSGVPVQ